MKNWNLVFKSFSDACSKINRSIVPCPSSLYYFSLFFFSFPLFIVCHWWKPDIRSQITHHLPLHFFPCLSSSPTYLFFSFPLIFHVILTSSFIFSHLTTCFSQTTDILLKILLVLHWHCVKTKSFIPVMCSHEYLVKIRFHYSFSFSYSDPTCRRLVW